MARKLVRPAALFAGGILILRAASLVRRPLWFDEMFTAWIARQPLREIVAHLRLDSGPPLFYVLAMPWVRIGEMLRFDPATRLLSFAAAAALFCATRPRYSGGARFALLLGASPLLFFYAGEARPYALLAAASFGLFLAGCRARDGVGGRIAAMIAAGALPWIHYLGLFVVAGSLIVCSMRRRWTSCLLQVSAASLFLLWAPIGLRQPPLSLAWNRSPASSFLRAPEAYGFWQEVAPYFSPWRTPAAWVGAALGIGLLLLGAARARTSRSIREALAFSLIPLLLVFGASAFRPIYYPGRSEMMTLPVALWAFARASRRSRGASALTAAAILAGTVVIAEGMIHRAGPFPYSETERFVVARARRGDLVVAGDSNYLPLRLASDRGRLAARLIGVPRAVELHPGWFEPVSGPDVEIEIERLRRELAVLPRGARADFAIPPDPSLRDLVQRCVPGEPRRILSPPGGTSILEIDR